MPRTNEHRFPVFSCQLSVFYHCLNLPSSQILRTLLENIGSAFDGETTSFPIPNDAPSEIPRVVFVNKDPNLRFEFSLSRFNFIRFATPVNPSVDMAQFFGESKRIYETLISKFSLVASRIAGVIVRYDDRELPGKFLADHFCKDQWTIAPFNRPESFELHAHKVFNLYEKDDAAQPLLVNSWVRCKSGFRKFGAGTETSAVIVEQDLNTLADRTTAMGLDEIDKFFQAVPKKCDEIFDLYFPE